MAIPIFIERSYYKITDFAYAVIPRHKPPLENFKKAKVIAHRGVHDNKTICENTMAAFQAALDRQIYGIECDIRWTKDCVPVVAHDPDCRRVFHKNIFISNIDFKTLRAQCPEIPTLEEVVLEFGKKLHLMFELKSDRCQEHELHSQRLQEVLSSLTPCDDFHILSLDPRMLNLAAFLPSKALLPIAILNFNKMSHLVFENKYGGLLGHYRLLPTKLIKKHLHAHHCTGTGLVMSKNCLFRELSRNVEWIFSNDPVKMQDLIQKYCKNQ